jgi:glucose-6-phosphate isomerase
MESNGKRVTCDGTELPFEAGEINFGEPGTNGQHSFYQLLHQGRVVPCDFVGVCKSQSDIRLAGDPVSSHDELMANFFAQPEALAFGRTAAEVEADGVATDQVAARTFAGNHPTTSMLVPELTPSVLGQLIALYEHRTFVQGAVWGIDSFDQWGVELGKKLAQSIIPELDGGTASELRHDSSTNALIRRYQEMRAGS